MKSDHQCPLCEAPLRACIRPDGKPVNLEVKPNPLGNAHISHFDKGTPIANVYPIAADIPPAEPFRYRVHNCNGGA